MLRSYIENELDRHDSRVIENGVEIRRLIGYSVSLTGGEDPFDYDVYIVYDGVRKTCTFRREFAIDLFVKVLEDNYVRRVDHDDSSPR